MSNIKDISDKQIHLIVNCGNKAHVIPVALIREIASGRTDSSKLTNMAIAKALMDRIDK